MQDLKDMTADSLDVLVDWATSNLMVTLKANLVAEIQKAMANQAVVGGYSVALDIGKRSIHRSTGYADPLPDFGRGFEDAHRSIARAIREAAVSIAREQLQAVEG